VLTAEENVAAILGFVRLQAPLRGCASTCSNLLAGNARGASCAKRACGPYTGKAAHRTDDNGQSSNWGRTNKDDIGLLAACRT